VISKNLDSLNLDSFPIVIFGSGPAGMSTALELEKKDIDSLMLLTFQLGHFQKSL
jgi:thioredoxin reductase